jgi:hypothetical protein
VVLSIQALGRCSELGYREASHSLQPAWNEFQENQSTPIYLKREMQNKVLRTESASAMLLT